VNCLRKLQITVSLYFIYSVCHANFESVCLCNILKTNIFGKIVGLLSDGDEDLGQSARNYLSKFANHGKSMLSVFWQSC